MINETCGDSVDVHNKDSATFMFALAQNAFVGGMAGLMAFERWGRVHGALPDGVKILQK